MNELTIQNEKHEVATTSVQNMIDSIARVASDPKCDVEKMERLLGIQLKMMDKQSKMEYDQALGRLQAKMPRIKQSGKIKTRDGTVSSKYMKYEDIDIIIRPLLQEEGFSIIHDRREENGKMVVISTLKHSQGHQESVSIPLPYDGVNALKNAVQAAVSTFSYGKRVNVCSLLNIVAEGDDDDGVSTGHIKIDDNQVEEINRALEETGADLPRFLQFMGVTGVEDIAMKDFGKAYTALRRKISQQGGASHDQA